MDKAPLYQDLANLHQQLSAAIDSHTALDEPSLQRLRQVANDIQEVLRQNAEGATTPTPPAESSPQSLESLAEKFSADYPQTSEILNQLGYLLGNMGL
jgi:hypothetical protein